MHLLCERRQPSSSGCFVGTFAVAPLSSLSFVLNALLTTSVEGSFLATMSRYGTLLPHEESGTTVSPTHTLMYVTLAASAVAMATLTLTTNATFSSLWVATKAQPLTTMSQSVLQTQVGYSFPRNHRMAVCVVYTRFCGGCLCSQVGGVQVSKVYRRLSQDLRFVCHLLFVSWKAFATKEGRTENIFEGYPDSVSVKQISEVAPGTKRPATGHEGCDICNGQCNRGFLVCHRHLMNRLCLFKQAMCV